MPKTTYLRDYQPSAYTADSIDLNFDLYEEHAQVHAKMLLRRQHQGPLHLYGKRLELVSIVMNDRMLTPEEYEIQDEHLIIPNTPEQVVLEITTLLRPQNNTELSGLYRSKDLFCTQCEAEGFRRITYFLDRPDVLATYTTRISADKDRYPVLLSNGNLIASGEEKEGRHWVVWQDPFKKPTYLFALVAGDLGCVSSEFTTCSGKKIDLRIYVEKGNENQCEHAMNSLKKSMRWDEKVYGREYDLDIYMIVAVSDFNMGAMENKGLNIFNSKFILGRPQTASDHDYMDIEGVIGHEYFHNWSGNRVTCRDWFQLSLKEGLTVFRDQQFSSDMNDIDVCRIMDVRVLLNTQFPEDAGPMAHPVRPESYEEINNFYTATVYNKGAEVIRMQHTLLGKEGFRRGMDLYFKRHDGQAVTIDDFVAAMEDANGRDLSQFKRWYSQAGTPQVTVTSTYEQEQLTLTFKQTCPRTPNQPHKEPVHIPIKVALLDRQGGMIPMQQEVLELTQTEQQFVIKDLKEQPVVSLLRGFSAPIQLIQEHTRADLLHLLRHETDGYAKWNAASLLVRGEYKNSLIDNQAVHVPKDIAQAFSHVMQDERINPFLRGELLTLPAFNEVIMGMTLVDVGLVESVRDTFQSQLGAYLYDDAMRLYEELWLQEDHRMDTQAYGRRKLRNMCLWYAMKGDEKQALKACHNQFLTAKTMTDQLASFSLLVDCTQEEPREQAIEYFFNQWAKYDLILEKWFALQASSIWPHTLEAVKDLLKHPAFNIKNPNKVRALVGTFTAANPRHFHAIDGSGYEFLAQMLLTLDQLNPQIAARLATPFTQYKRYDAPRQKLMLEQLTHLSSSSLSRDLSEIVSKTLAEKN